MKKRLVIVGSGWAGFQILRNIDYKLYDVQIISPEDHFVFTPLLASTCVGTLEFESVVERIAIVAPKATHLQGYCINIDLKNMTISYNESGNIGDCFTEILYDVLVVAVGAARNTFGIKGVEEGAFFLHSINDAKRIRERIKACFEKALGSLEDEEALRKWLYFVIVGGGPTGIEFAAELNDLFKQDLLPKHPSLSKYFKISIYESSNSILKQYPRKLVQFVEEKFSKQGIKVFTKKRVESMDDGCVIVEGQKIEPGLVLWSAGLAAIPLTQTIGETGALLDHRGFQLVTNDALQLLNSKDRSPYPNVYGVGDCATVEETALPCSAQVAKSKADHLVQALNHPDKPLRPFIFKDAGIMAYTGGRTSIVSLNLTSRYIDLCGTAAWMLWRFAYWTMVRSWRNRWMILKNWSSVAMFGRKPFQL